MRVSRDQYVDLSGARGSVHRRWGVSQHDVSDLVLRSLGGRVVLSLFEVHGGYSSADHAPDHEEKDSEDQQNQKPKDADVQEKSMHPG